MLDKLIEIGGAIVGVILMMAPYLLLGFAFAALLSFFFTPAWVTRHLGRPGLLQVVKASLIGVPLPLCSCGVLPLAFSLRKSGASKGATVSFLVSTPQTGADCFMLTYSLLGPVMAFLLLGVAFFSGLLSGWLTDLLCRHETDATRVEEPCTSCCCEKGEQVSRPEEENSQARLLRALRNGFLTLPRDMARPLLLGVLVSGLVTALVPQGYLANYLAPGPLSYFLALSIGIPMYVCSASAVPIAAMMIHAGVSPGAAMVFLIAGPATNTAAIFALWNQIGRRATLAYLLTISGVALVSGFVLDLLFRVVVPALPHLHQHDSGMPVWQWASSFLLLILLLPGLFRSRENEKRQGEI
ncbi:MAG: SO_0444 family Cu/Zn efflux transporter [bacterium]